MVGQKGAGGWQEGAWRLLGQLAECVECAESVFVMQTSTSAVLIELK